MRGEYDVYLALGGLGVILCFAAFVVGMLIRGRRR